MPTGYTHAVQNGTITEFADFAMQCARAFGACITMRDDPMDAQIPDEFKPDGYSAIHLKESQAEFAALTAMSEAEKEAAAFEEYDDELCVWKERQREKVEQRARYEAMLRKVEEWTPPTSDHEGLKKFMRDQLSESIDFNCRPTSTLSTRPEPKSANAWHATKLADIQRDISYHAKENAEDIERARNRTEWVRALRASLKTESTNA